jgi:hypothetical protein
MFSMLSRVRPVQFAKAAPALRAFLPSRAISNVVSSDFAGLAEPRSGSLGAIFSTARLYKTDITAKQFEILEELRFMRIVPVEQAKILENIEVVEPGLTPEQMRADSVLRKRRLKMKKHKLRKRRKAQRALRRKLKKD